MKMRLHVAIAHAGVTSRRKAEELIAAGNVQVNGKTVKVLGFMVDPNEDTIVVNGKKIKGELALLYFLEHKPRGVVSTISDPDGKRTVIDIFRRFWKKFHPDTELPRLYPVGRLDEDSEGLILLTNDGDLSFKLTHPKFEVKKTYEVLVKGAPTNTQLQQLQKGVKLKEGFSQIDSVSIIKHEGGNTWISLTIHQGMHQQVRRTLAMVGLEVLRLIRVQMGPLSLGKIKPGEIMEIEKPEVI